MLYLHKPESRTNTPIIAQGCRKEAYNKIRKPFQLLNSLTRQIPHQQNQEYPSLKNQSKESILEIFCQLLQNIIKKNANLLVVPSIFDLKNKSSIQIEDFVSRIFNYMQCSESCYIAAIILLDRLQSFNVELRLSNSNIHKLIMTAILIAAKYCDDNTYHNAYYCKIAGLTLTQLNELELQFLIRVNFEIYIDPKVYEQYCIKLEAFLRRRKKEKFSQQP